MKRPYLITDSTAPAGDEQQHLRSHIMSLGRHFPCTCVELIMISAATEVLVPSSHVITHVEGIQALRK
jgi:hypothetical protein